MTIEEVFVKLEECDKFARQFAEAEKLQFQKLDAGLVPTFRPP